MSDAAAAAAAPSPSPNPAQAAAAPAVAGRAITTPALDALCVGGLSLAVLIPLMALGRLREAAEPFEVFGLGSGGGRLSLSQVLLFTVFLNLPHFMGSYALVYGSRAAFARHPWAAVRVPALLAAYGLFALFMCRSTDAYVGAMVAVAGGYLAWHYTGQAWGMMATFSFVGGTPFDARERTLMRTALRILLVWHVVWFLHVGGGLPEPLRRAASAVYPLLSGAAVGSLLLALASLVRLSRRHGRLPPWRVVLPCAAIYTWYLALALEPRAIFLVQMSHSLQYLIFPARVDLNRAGVRSRGRAVVRTATYLAVLAAVGVGVVYLLPWAVRGPIEALLGPLAAVKLTAVVVAFVNIHHYFTDGVAWKISNPEVRRDLFAHLPSP